MDNEKIEKRFLFDINTAYRKDLRNDVTFGDTIENILLVIAILKKNGYKDLWGHDPDYYTRRPVDYPYTNYKYLKIAIDNGLKLFIATKYESDVRIDPSIHLLPNYVKEYKL